MSKESWKILFNFIGGVVDLVFKDEIPAIQAEVDQLKEDGVNIIIALGHAGFTKDKQVAAEVSGVDVVVGGHSNTFLYSGTLHHGPVS